MNQQKNDDRKSIISNLTIEAEVAKRDMDAAFMNFNNVFSKEETDIYIYRFREAQTKYGSLIKKLKEIS